MKHENIIFDLDGTLCDSEECILSTLEATLAEMGEPVLPREVLRRFISPPLIDSFIRYCGFTEEQAAKGLKIYQRIYAEGGWDKHVLFDGIEDILKALQSRGAQLFVATSKEEGAAEHVLESMGIKGYFRAVSGANKDNSISKKKDILLSLYPTIDSLKGITLKELLQVVPEKSAREILQKRDDFFKSPEGNEK